MKIIHFSDSHAGGTAESLSALFDKRIVGIINYKFRRKFQHDQKLLKAAVDYILSEKPDLAVCTGDITSTGQPGEFRQAIEILDPLVRNSQIPFIYVPGNHDCYVKNSECVAVMKETVKYLNRNLFSFEQMPLKLKIGDCDFLLVNESVPTNIFSSCGYVDKKTVAFIVKECEEKTERPIVFVGHFPVDERYPIRRFRHRLWGQQEILDLIRGKRIDLSLCGHIHTPYSSLDGNGRGETSAGSVTKTHSVSVIDYDKTENKFSLKNISLP